MCIGVLESDENFALKAVFKVPDTWSVNLWWAAIFSLLIYGFIFHFYLFSHMCDSPTVGPCNIFILIATITEDRLMKATASREIIYYFCF